MLRSSAVLVFYLGMENTTAASTATLTLTHTASLSPAFQQWAEDNLVFQDLALVAEDLMQGKIQALKELVCILEGGNRHYGKAFSDHVLCTLGEGLKKEI